MKLISRYYSPIQVLLRWCEDNDMSVKYTEQTATEGMAYMLLVIDPTPEEVAEISRMITSTDNNEPIIKYVTDISNVLEL